VGDCVVIGNEGHGLSNETIASCDRTVFIPMTERAESLNAAVAASLLMWSFRAENQNVSGGEGV
jgi:TrmH family RNA methyltransferase